MGLRSGTFAGHVVITYSASSKASEVHPCVIYPITPIAQVVGQTDSFLEHIRLGVEAASKDPVAMLLFSGGKTRRAAGPRAEGESYWLVAEAQTWFGHPDVRERAYTEVGDRVNGR